MAKQAELRRFFNAVLSKSLVSEGGKTYCTQGGVQRILTPLKGYYPEIRLDAFEPPTEGDFVRSLQRVLDEAAPGADLKMMARQEAAAAIKRAQINYAPISDDDGRVSDGAEQRSRARVAKVENDIAAYLAYDELISASAHQPLRQTQS